MNIDDLIKSEYTNVMKESWTDYRNALSSYIEKIILDDMADRSFVDKHPTIAIWGAGCCADIDIVRLSKIAKLVLIDCDKKKCQRAIEESGLSESQAVSANLFFYDITYENYEDLEHLLYEGAGLDVVHQHLSNTLIEAVSTDLKNIPEFNYSVVVGLSSQMNARIAALAYLYRDRYSQAEITEIYEHIKIMDREAVKRLIQIVKATTDCLTVYGYEDKIIETGEELNLYANELIKQEFGEGVDSLIWPFAEGKSYEMKFIKI